MVAKGLRLEMLQAQVGDPLIKHVLAAFQQEKGTWRTEPEQVRSMWKALKQAAVELDVIASKASASSAAKQKANEAK